jgi:hypothetical protein
MQRACAAVAGSRAHTDSCLSSNSTRFRSYLKTYLPVLRVPLRESPRELLNLHFLESITALHTRWLHTFVLFRTFKCVALPSLTSHHHLHQAHALLWVFKLVCRNAVSMSLARFLKASRSRKSCCRPFSRSHRSACTISSISASCANFSSNF